MDETENKLSEASGEVSPLQCRDDKCNKKDSCGKEPLFKENDSSSYESEEDVKEDDEDAGLFTKIANLLKSKLSIEKPQKVLEEVNINGIVKYMKSDECKNIIVMAGAGISTSAGIPDFRSPNSGLYNNLAKYDLPYPEAIFEISYFQKKPEAFFALAKELYPCLLTPTLCHFFIKLLFDKGLLLRHYTQNIDTLEHVAGLPPDKVIEAHGTFRTVHCISCHTEHTQEWIKEEIFADRTPKCKQCSSLVKPDIVFFGETLPTRFFTAVSSDFSKCNLLIIMGTSLTVQPFASLIDNIPSECPRLLINREKVSSSNPLAAILGGGLNLDEGSTRDVAMIGDCDEMCLQLAEKLGWKEDLENLKAAYNEKCKL